MEINLKIDNILDNPNIADVLDENERNYIASEVLDGYSLDKTSRADWEDNIDEWTKLALQVAETKSFPWPNAANVKYPLLTTAAMQFSARAYPALVPGHQAVRGRVIGFDYDGSKLERSIRVGKHMSYQLFEEMDDWEEQMDRLLFALPILGCMFKKSYYSSIKQHNISEVVYPKELVVNYWATSLEDAPRITHILNLSENDVYERVKEGTFLDEELEKSSNADTNNPHNVGLDAVGVVAQSSEDGSTPYEILEQHCWIDLDGDGYKEPYIATVDSGSEKLLRLVARFDEEDVLYADDGDIWRIEPTHYFTKFSFVPSPDGGFYDVGFGTLLGPINETVNTIINQLLDAGTLSNMQGGFIAKGIRIKGGDRSFRPGEWKYANSTGDDLRKGIVPMPTRDPSQVLFSLLGMMIEAGEKLSSVTDMLMGNIPGQNTKATVAMAAIEEGMKVFSSIYKRVHRSLSKEYKKLFSLNAKFLPEESYFTILDVGQEAAAQIGRTDYDEDNVDIVPSSDPNVATEQQRLAKVEALLQLLQMGTINVQEVTRRYLEATEQPNIEALMKVPPPQPNPEVEFEMKKFEDESQRAWATLELEQRRMEADSLLKLAQAENLEEGRQLEMYKTELKTLVDRESIITNRVKNANNQGTVR